MQMEIGLPHACALQYPAILPDRAVHGGVPAGMKAGTLTPNGKILYGGRRASVHRVVRVGNGRPLIGRDSLQVQAQTIIHPAVSDGDEKLEDHNVRRLNLFRMAATICTFALVESYEQLVSRHLSVCTSAGSVMQSRQM